MSKSTIRKNILNVRKLLFDERKKIDFKCLLKVINKYTKKKKPSIGGYYPINYEIDCLEILNKLEKKKFNISLPVIKNDNLMDFYSYSFKNPLHLNKYGIPEPNSKKIIFPDIILVPMVAFDQNLFRLGFGGGYYDRYIEKINKKKTFLTIGLAFECQRLKKIPTDKFDKSLHVIITESNIFL